MTDGEKRAMAWIEAEISKGSLFKDTVTREPLPDLEAVVASWVRNGRVSIDYDPQRELDFTWSFQELTGVVQ